MIPTDKSEPQLLPAPILASNIERDTATRRLQAAFAEHRLTDDEFDQRIRHALTARTTTELDGLTADLPAAAPHRPADRRVRSPPPVPAGRVQRASRRRPGPPGELGRAECELCGSPDAALAVTGRGVWPAVHLLLRLAPVLRGRGTIRHLV